MNMYLQEDISIIILRIVRNTKFDEHCIDRKTSQKPEQFFQQKNLVMMQNWSYSGKTILRYL